MAESEETVESLKEALHQATLSLQQLLPIAQQKLKTERSENVRKQFRTAVTSGLLQKVKSQSKIGDTKGLTLSKKEDLENGDFSTAAKIALVKRNEQQEKDELEKEGVMESHTLVVTMDVIYIAIAFALPSLTIASLHPKSTSFNDPNQRVLLFVFDIVAQLFTFAWIGLQCVEQRKDGWKMIIQRSEILSRYLRERFWIDLLYAFPIEWAFINPTDELSWKIFTWISVRNGLRLLRMFDVTTSNNPLLGTRTLLQFFAILSISFFGCAAFAAIFWSFEDVDFVAAVYWTAATVTTTGYGDVSAKGRDSKIYSFIVMFIGLAGMSLLSGWATKLLTESDRITRRKEEDKELLHSMLEFYEVPWTLRRELINVFPLGLEKKQADDFRSMMEILPGAITDRIQVFVTCHFLRGLPMFCAESSFPSPKVALPYLAQRMERRFVLSDQVIVLNGSIGTEMFIIAGGVCSEVTFTFFDHDSKELPGDSTDIVRCEQKAGESLGIGDFFGHEALSKLPYSRTIMTMSVTEVVTLSYSSYRNVVTTHPEIEQYLEENLLRGPAKPNLIEDFLGITPTTTGPADPS